MAKQTSLEEVRYVGKMGLYRTAPVTECWERIGKKRIQVRWIDVNRGDVKQPNYRFRLLAEEINTYKRQDLFAAIPPLEALKIDIIDCCYTKPRRNIDD